MLLQRATLAAWCGTIRRGTLQPGLRPPNFPKPMVWGTGKPDMLNAEV
jgi:hypothetical protein